MRLTTRWTVLLFVLGVSANSAFAIDPALSLDQNVIRTWGVDQGLPQGTVYALAQTADGYVWAATQEGFVRFDGTEFITYDKATAQQIHNNMTLALLSARDGSLYAATNGGGVVQVQGRRIRSYEVADGMPSDAATTLYESGNGTIWNGTGGNGLLRYRSGQFRTYSTTDGLPSANVSAIYEDSHGTLWIGTLDHGVGRFRNERFDFASEAIGIGNKAVSSFLEDREGNLWIGSANGLTRVAEGAVITFTTAQGLLADKVRTVSA